MASTFLNRLRYSALLLLMGGEILICSCASGAALETVPKWERYEHTFKSRQKFEHFPAHVSLAVKFVSPDGETNLVAGFWNGGKEWRVRFAPDRPGKWNFITECFPTDLGLNHLSGQFLCVAPAGDTELDKHGPPQLDRTGRHLEYADHTPFLWVAEVVWAGAVKSKTDDWSEYAGKRAEEKFNVLQWLAYSPNLENQTAFTFGNTLELNLPLLKKLDERVAAANAAGLINAIVPYGEVPYTTDRVGIPPTAQQIEQIWQYLLARWGANKVVWIMACSGERAAAWKKIGQDLFAAGAHAPVLVTCGQDYWALKQFSNEAWVSGLGYQSGPDNSDDALEWMVAGPLKKDAGQTDARPYFNLLPPLEQESGGKLQVVVDEMAVRRAAAWTALLVPTSGFSYGARNIWNWPVEKEFKYSTPDPHSLPPWSQGLNLPGGQQMQFLADFLKLARFQDLSPAPKLIYNQSGEKTPAHFIAAAMTVQKDLAAIYIPSSRIIELDGREMMPTEATWFNPRTGTNLVAEIKPYIRNYRLTTPEPGDWVLLLKTTATSHLKPE